MLELYTHLTITRLYPFIILPRHASYFQYKYVCYFRDNFQKSITCNFRSYFFVTIVWFLFFLSKENLKDVIEC